jgi:HKD family nuclease
MKILKSSLAVNDEIARLLQECDSCQIAVAWASPNFDCFHLLVENKPKIERMVVGLHFAQTHPKFLETFLNDTDAVRFFFQKEGVFHPKLYIFKHSEGWECVVGSPNFTKAAFTKNTETAVLIGHEDIGAEAAYEELNRMIDDYWATARTLTQNELDKYTAEWTKSRKRRTKVQKATQATLEAILPTPPTELSAAAFTSLIHNAIEKIPGILKRWAFSKAGKTLKCTCGYSGDVVVQLWIDPKGNKCYFEATDEDSPSTRDPIAASIRTHLKTLHPPKGSVFPTEGGGIIRLEPPLHVKHLLNSVTTHANQQELFVEEADRAIALFRFIDHAMQSWSFDS